MPELPEVETVCRTLHPLLSGKRIVTFELLWPRTLAVPDEADFLRRIARETISHVDRRAKLIVIHLAVGGAVTVHLRMTGELLFRDAHGVNEPYAETPYLRAAFLFDDGAELLFRDIRKFGRIAYLNPEQLAELDNQLGIEPLGEAFTPQWLSANLRNHKRQLKPLLLDQTFIAGLGNIYVDESLFKAGLHPLTRSDSVSDDQAQRLHAAIVGILNGAIQRRGTTLRDFRSGLGERGENQFKLVVYGSKPGSPCPRCDAALERLVIGQRGSIFCPSCQPLSTTSRTRNR